MKSPAGSSKFPPDQRARAAGYFGTARVTGVGMTLLVPFCHIACRTVRRTITGFGRPYGQGSASQRLRQAEAGTIQRKEVTACAIY